MANQLVLTPEIEELFQRQNDKLTSKLNAERDRRDEHTKMQIETQNLALDAGRLADDEWQGLAVAADKQQEIVDQMVSGLKVFVHHRVKKDEAKSIVAESSYSANSPPNSPRGSVKRKSRRASQVKVIDEDEDPPDYPWLWNDVSASKFGKFVTGMLFDSVSAGVIVVNAVFIGYSSQYAIDRYMYPADERVTGFIDGMEWFFFIFYLIELTLKLYVWRMRFFYNDDWMWNSFDFTLVVLALYDVLIATFETGSDGAGSNMTWMRLLRLLKMLKMLRVIRVMRAFRELRLLLFSILASLRSLLWSFLMLGLILYIFGLCFLQGVTAWLEDDAKNDNVISHELKANAKEYWGSVSGSMLTLYMCISGGLDWSVPSNILKDVGFVYYYLFIFYQTFLIFAVTNVMMGLFVERAMVTAEVDKVAVTKEELGSNQSSFHGIHEILKGLERVDGGGVSWEDFAKELSADEGSGKLASLLIAEGIDDREASELFRVLSGNFKHLVTPLAYTEGCTKAKGKATGLDMIRLMFTCNGFMYTQPLLMRYVEDSFKDVHAIFGKTSIVKPLSRRLAEFRNEPEDEPKKKKKESKMLVAFSGVPREDIAEV